MRLKILAASLAAAFVFPTTTSSQGQGKWGAIAWITVSSDFWLLGFSRNYEQQPDAEWEARRACEPSDPVACHLALVLEDECGAAAVSEEPQQDIVILGFGKAGDEITARRRARSDCRDNGGSSCIVGISGCSVGTGRSRTDSAERGSTTVRAAPVATIGAAPTESPDFRLDSADCDGQPGGASCWMELSNQPGCRVWIPEYVPGEERNWSGECSGGVAHGFGTLVKSGEPWSSLDSLVHEGSYENGRQNGHWVTRFPDIVNEGSYHGVEEGTYVDGNKEGSWIMSNPDGRILLETLWERGDIISMSDGTRETLVETRPGSRAAPTDVEPVGFCGIPLTEATFVMATTDGGGHYTGWGPRRSDRFEQLNGASYDFIFSNVLRDVGAWIDFRDWYMDYIDRYGHDTAGESDCDFSYRTRTDEGRGYTVNVHIYRMRRPLAPGQQDAQTAFYEAWKDSSLDQRFGSR